MAYIDVATVKTYLGIESANNDALITQKIAEAEDLFERLTGRQFEVVADAVRYFDAVADVVGRYLYVDEDLCAITSIVNGDGNVIDAPGYVTEPRNETPYFAIKLKSATSWTYSTDPENAIAINGRWGYSVTPPEAVKSAVTRLASFLYRQKDSQVFDVVAMPGKGEMIIPQGFPKDVWRVVLHFAKVV